MLFVALFWRSKLKWCILSCLPVTRGESYQLPLHKASIRQSVSDFMKLLKASQLVSFWHRPYCTLTLNSNFAILKKNYYFSIRVKELFEPLVLRRKGNKWLLSLKAFSWETDLKIWFGRNKICCAEDNYSYRYMSN